MNKTRYKFTLVNLTFSGALEHRKKQVDKLKGEIANLEYQIDVIRRDIASLEIAPLPDSVPKYVPVNPGEPGYKNAFTINPLEYPGELKWKKVRIRL